MSYDIDKNRPAFIFEIDNKKYILKVNLAGGYELFSYNLEDIETNLKIVYSCDEFYKYIGKI